MSCLLFHRWSTWSDIRILSNGDYVQSRFCRKCRLGQQRKVDK